jgi:SAM-dependent methyltransferase
VPRLGRWRLIVDREPRRGADGAAPQDIAYRTDLGKEEVARHYVLERPGEGMAFLDVGARDGRLEYLLGVRSNLDFDPAMHERNLARFQAKYEYFGLDLDPEEAPNVLQADLCEEDLPIVAEYRERFDVVYSNNVFEHLRRPWIAARHILEMVKPGGTIITIAPFALRYHAVPGDYFRYTHEGLTALFADQGEVEELVSGNDTAGRRMNWQGQGTHSDLVPEDHFGAWRETWFTINVLRKGDRA